VFPNPNEGTFIVQWNANRNFEKVQLFDLQGRKITFKQTDLLSKKSIEIETENLSQGIYILKIYLGNEIISQEIMIQ